MPYIIGIVLSVAVALFARCVGFDRDRAFYPTVLIVIASYYVLFAAMSESVHTVLLESIVMTGFLIAAVVGFKSSPWIVVAALAGHASWMPFTAMSWKTQVCQFGGLHFVSLMISGLQVALPGFLGADLFGPWSRTLTAGYRNERSCHHAVGGSDL